MNNVNRILINAVIKVFFVAIITTSFFTSCDIASNDESFTQEVKQAPLDVTKLYDDVKIGADVANGNPVTKQWYVSTVAGSGMRGRQDGEGMDAQFYYPTSIALAPDNMIYVVDANN